MRVAKRVRDDKGEWVSTTEVIELPDEWDSLLVQGHRPVSEEEVSVIRRALEDPEHDTLEKVFKAFNIREGSTIPFVVQRIVRKWNQNRLESMTGEDATEDQDSFFDALFGRLSAEHKSVFAEESPRAWLRVEKARTSLDRADVSRGIDALKEFMRRHGIALRDEGRVEIPDTSASDVQGVIPQDGNESALEGEEPY